MHIALRVAFARLVVHCTAMWAQAATRKRCLPCIVGPCRNNSSTPSSLVLVREVWPLRLCGNDCWSATAQQAPYPGRTLFRWIQREMWQIKICHPDLWRSIFRRPSLRWMDPSLSSSYQYKQATWLVISSIMLERSLKVRASSPMPVSDGRDVTDYATEPGSGD